MQGHSIRVDQSALELAARLLAGARHGLVLTGAGVSAESGIPTFRGEGGLWTKYDPVKVSSIDSFLADPASYWRVSKERGAVALAAKPNPGHVALAVLESAGHLAAIVTQNTDGLHQQAGASRVIELHGSGRKVQCMECGNVESRRDVQDRLDLEMPPRCPACGGAVLKPTVVLFGEPMPAEAVKVAYALAESTDVMLVVGTSLVVYPAAEIPLIAVRAGARMMVINAEPTPFDALAEVVIHGRSGEMLPAIVSLIGA